jgi:hypothetical protein
MLKIVKILAPKLTILELPISSKEKKQLKIPANNMLGDFLNLGKNLSLL